MVLSQVPFGCRQRRLEHELAGLLRRMHILEGFVLIFDALDEIIRIIRRSEGKADAAEKIMQRFPAAKGGLDAEQTDAILELKLYRLARLEINLIQEELKAKQKRAREIQRLLKEKHRRHEQLGSMADRSRGDRIAPGRFCETQGCESTHSDFDYRGRTGVQRRRFHCRRRLPCLVDSGWLGQKANSKSLILRKVGFAKGIHFGGGGWFHSCHLGFFSSFGCLLHFAVHRHSSLDGVR